MAEGVRCGTHFESWRERIPHCRSCKHAETSCWCQKSADRYV